MGLEVAHRGKRRRRTTVLLDGSTGPFPEDLREANSGRLSSRLPEALESRQGLPADDGSIWAIQRWQQLTHDYGGIMGVEELEISHYTTLAEFVNVHWQTKYDLPVLCGELHFKRAGVYGASSSPTGVARHVRSSRRDRRARFRLRTELAQSELLIDAPSRRQLVLPLRQSRPWKWPRREAVCNYRERTRCDACNSSLRRPAGLRVLDERLDPAPVCSPVQRLIPRYVFTNLT